MKISALDQPTESYQWLKLKAGIAKDWKIELPTHKIKGMNREFDEARVGQLCAWSISIAFLVAGSFVATKGQPWVGALFGGMGVSGIVANFIQGKKRQDASPEPQPTPQDPSRKKRKR